MKKLHFNLFDKMYNIWGNIWGIIFFDCIKLLYLFHLLLVGLFFFIPLTKWRKSEKIRPIFRVVISSVRSSDQDLSFFFWWLEVLQRTCLHIRNWWVYANSVNPTLRNLTCRTFDMNGDIPPCAQFDKLIVY